MPRPARVVQQAACKRDHIRLALGDDRFGLLRFGDFAHRDGSQAGVGAHTLGKRHLIARAYGNVLAMRNATGGHINKIAPPTLKQFGDQVQSQLGVELQILDPVVDWTPELDEKSGYPRP